MAVHFIFPVMYAGTCDLLDESHSNFFCHPFGSEITHADQTDQLWELQNIECILAHSTGRFGCIASIPIIATEVIAKLRDLLASNFHLLQSTVADQCFSLSKDD